MFNLYSGSTNRDSLFLSIFTPSFAGVDSHLPVKVWIHGGAFAAGSITDPLYNGCSLATDSIVVLVAYRLGALGFLYAPDVGIQGNMAIQDLATALEWVQSNIGSFGGDPVGV
jgi:para-nitrobenzyl esterase